ncbi:MAG: ATP-dependent helicase [Candidatus Saccharibacteria bacterium]|nr:ATP-dependent helicase [Candidatus Saccharibacteria bacterium]
MRDYATNYHNLNANQRLAVDTTEGPLVVIAGPGTGKTQLLSMRVAAILQQPNTTPDQILCLTFTDSAARNMQDRLVSIVGRPAYHVAIHTFHSFADRIINNYPDYFIERPLLRPIDELGQFQLLRRIFDKLPYSNPLGTKLGDEYLFLKDARRTIGWLKQAGIAAAKFATI